jgi:hypothetical protein
MPRHISSPVPSPHFIGESPAELSKWHSRRTWSEVLTRTGSLRVVGALPVEVVVADVDQAVALAAALGDDVEAGPDAAGVHVDAGGVDEHGVAEAGDVAGRRGTAGSG